MNIKNIEEMSINYYSEIIKKAELATIITVTLAIISYTAMANAVLGPVIEACIKADDIIKAVDKIQEAHREYQKSYGFKDEKGADYTAKFNDFYQKLSLLKENVIRQKNARNNSNDENISSFKQFAELVDEISYKSEFILTALNSMKNWGGKLLDNPIIPLSGLQLTSTTQMEKNINILREHMLLQKGILEDKAEELKSKTQSQQVNTQISQEEQNQFEQLSNITW